MFRERTDAFSKEYIPGIQVAAKVMHLDCTPQRTAHFQISDGAPRHIAQLLLPSLSLHPFFQGIQLLDALLHFQVTHRLRLANVAAKVTE